MSPDNLRTLAASLVAFLLIALPVAASTVRDADRTVTPVYPLLTGPWAEQAKLTAADGSAFYNFGISVALAAETVLVGAFGATVEGNISQGAAYVFTESEGGWSQRTKLAADDGAPVDGFGRSVALAGDSALVGAPSADVGSHPDRGAAYVFADSGGVGSQQAKLIADDGAADDQFGISVALAGDTALVATPFAQVDGNFNEGAVYVFTRIDGVWSQQEKLSAIDGGVGYQFGSSVALEGDTALVGSLGAQVDGTPNQGAAYIFTRSGEVWTQQAKLTAGDGTAGDNFGASVALAGDTALVGARYAEVDGNLFQGAAYAFTRSGDLWIQQAKLTAEDGTESAELGGSVALAADTALVGARAADVGGNSGQGAAYLFTRSGETWSQRARLTAADGAESDFFSVSVALTSNRALVGANGADVDGKTFQGAAYVFRPPLTPTALAVDPEPMAAADGNGVFEPGETVDVVPEWRNNGAAPLDVMGTASGFTGPSGATYTLAEDGADYGTLDPDQSASCLDTGPCYVMGVNDPAARPAPHWDATFDETLSDETVKAWTLHLGDSFADVPRGGLFYSWIETLLHSRVTKGCDDADYCPAGTSTRGQMPAFVLRALLGPEFTPEPCVEGQERFADVPANHLFCPWIEALAGRGVVRGCDEDNYCPGRPVTRAQMAIFLLRTLEGADYTPPECEGVFADVDCPSIFADWVEELFRRGITGGCGEAPRRYCPGAPNTRGQMAVFLSKTFGLRLYGP